MPPPAERPIIAVLCERAPTSLGEAETAGPGMDEARPVVSAAGSAEDAAGTVGTGADGAGPGVSAAGSAGPGVDEARPVVNAVGSAGPGVDEARPVVNAVGSAGPAVAAAGPAVKAADATGSGVDAVGRAVDVAWVEGAEVEFRFCDAEGLREAVRGARGVLLWDYFSPAVRGVWGDAGSVEWIHVTAAGVDTLLFDELRDSDVVVTNAHGVFDRPIAEYVLGAVIAHAKKSRLSLELQRRREWRHRETRSVLGAKALVVGTGGIGRETARLLRAAGLEVRGAGRVARSGDPDFGEVVASGNLSAAVGWADHVVLAVPLTDATRGMVDAGVLAAMRPGAHLINIARGPIVDEAALLKALYDGRIAATLDVFDREPLPADHPLWDAPNVTITAHMSGDVVGWRETLSAQFVANVRRWLAGEPLLNVVDKKLGYVPAGDR